MSSQDDGSKYIKCSCQHCGGHIKFEASQLRQGEVRKVECPHCHLETPIFLPHSSETKTANVSTQTKSTRLELFLFELTRYPVLIAAFLILVALVITIFMAYDASRPVKPANAPAIAYEVVAPQAETPSSTDNSYASKTPKVSKMAGKKAFPQPVSDFLIKHIGFSLKEWLDQVGSQNRQAFLDNLADVLQKATASRLTDDQQIQLVKNFGDAWVSMVNSEMENRLRVEKQKEKTFQTTLLVGSGLLSTLFILCLILVLLAIERNTRTVLNNQKPR
jgi:uncharacterized membrane protein YqjE